MDEVRPTRADVRTEHVTAVALIVHADRKLNVRVGDGRDVTEDINLQAQSQPTASMTDRNALKADKGSSGESERKGERERERGGGIEAHRQTADGREEDLQVGTRDQLRVHAVGFMEQALTQRRLRAIEALSNSRQKPNGLNGRL